VGYLARPGLAGSGEERWLRIAQLASELSVHEWARDIDFSGFLHESARVGALMAKTIGRWRHRRVDELSRETTIFAALMMIIETARRVDHKGFPLAVPPEGKTAFGLASLTRADSGDLCPAKMDGLPIPGTRLARPGDPIRGHAVYRLADGETLMLLKNGALAREIQAELNRPAGPLLSEAAVAECQKLRKDRVRMITEPKRRFAPMDPATSAAWLERLRGGVPRPAPAQAPGGVVSPGRASGGAVSPELAPGVAVSPKPAAGVAASPAP
jgi:hypothetical protein